MSRSSPGGIHTTGRVPIRWSLFSPRASSLSVLFTIPSINFALPACTNLSLYPACSISSTIQYQLPIVFTATGEPSRQRKRNSRKPPVGEVSSLPAPRGPVRLPPPPRCTARGSQKTSWRVLLSSFCRLTLAQDARFHNITSRDIPYLNLRCGSWEDLSAG